MPKVQHFGSFLDAKKVGLSKNGLIITVSFLAWELWHKFFRLPHLVYNILHMH